MYKNVFRFTLGLMLTIVSITVNAQQDKKSEKARKDIAEAKEDLRLAKIDSVEDYQKFRVDADAKIAQNQLKIKELKEQKVSDNIEIKEKYQKKILVLEQKNNDLKNKIEESDKTKSSKWNSFKKEFNHDMEQLGKAIKDVGIDNKQQNKKEAKFRFFFVFINLKIKMMETTIIAVILVLIGLSIMGYCGYNNYKFENIENLNKPKTYSRTNLHYAFTPIAGLFIFIIGMLMLLIIVIVK